MLTDSPNSSDSRLRSRYRGLPRRSLGASPVEDSPWRARTEGGFFPNRDLLLQLIHDPFTRLERRGPMLRANSQKQGRFAGSHKSDAMMKHHLAQSERHSRGISNDFHLMLGHGLVSLIIDPFDFTTILQFSNNAPEIDYRSSRKACPERSRRIDIFLRRVQARFGQQNLRNGVCHAFESPTTM